MYFRNILNSFHLLQFFSKNEESNETENKKPVQSAGQSSPVVLNLKPKEIKPRKEKAPV